MNNYRSRKKQINSKPISLVGEMYRLDIQGGKHSFTRKSIPEYKNRIYSAYYVIQQNEQLEKNGQVIDVDVEQTFKLFESKRSGNMEKLLDNLKEESENQKILINLGEGIDYKKALQRGNVDYKPVILWLDETIAKIEDFLSNKGTKNTELEELKEEAKDLGLIVKGRQTVDGLKSKIEEAKTSLN